MKKIILLSILIISTLGITSTYANTDKPKPIKVQVTEKMPWMENCYQTKSKSKSKENLDSEQVKKWETYTCEVQPGFWSVQTMLGGIVKYFTFIAGIAGVLFLVINGIMYSMWDKEEAKKRITKTLVGLIVLFSSWVILNLVAPWIYK